MTSDTPQHGSGSPETPSPLDPGAQPAAAAPPVPPPVSPAPVPPPVSPAPVPPPVSPAPETALEETPGRSKTKRSTRRLVTEYALTAVVALVVAFFVQAYVVKPYRVPTPSMATTIQPGDRVLIDRFLFDSREIDRGDIKIGRAHV